MCVDIQLYCIGQMVLSISYQRFIPLCSFSASNGLRTSACARTLVCVSVFAYTFMLSSIFELISFERKSIASAQKLYLMLSLQIVVSAFVCAPPRLPFDWRSREYAHSIRSLACSLTYELANCPTKTRSIQAHAHDIGGTN